MDRETNVIMRGRDAMYEEFLNFFLIPNYYLCHVPNSIDNCKTKYRFSFLGLARLAEPPKQSSNTHLAR